LLAKEITVMNKRLLFSCLVLAVLRVPDRACGQFNDPRVYENTPVGTNRLELGYVYLHANASLDTSLVVTGAKLNLNQGIIDYTRYFGFFHHLMWTQARVPVAGLSGSISGTNIQASTKGAGDSSYALGMLLKGGPALSVEQFQHYQPTTTLGLSLTMTAPTGSYQPSRILNLGSDRWSFKPELAWSHPFGHEQQWELDAYANVSFYTDNTSYHGKEILRQDPLPGIEGHLSYSFTDNIWMPVNALLIRGLLNLYQFYGDDFKVECPTRSGKYMTLFEVAKEIARRLESIFLRDAGGKRPDYGGTKKFQEDPHWKDYITFYEYFHGDNGAGLGASHQTGWTGVIARSMDLFARTGAADWLQTSKGELAAKMTRAQVAGTGGRQ
jgi:hypothetical protein